MRKYWPNANTNFIQADVYPPVVSSMCLVCSVVYVVYVVQVGDSERWCFVVLQ